MKTLGMLFCALAYTVFAASALSAQEKVAVLPPQGGKNVSDISKKTVRNAFLDYLSEPGSGFAAHDSHSIDMTVQGPSWRTSALYDEKTARDIGRKLGVPLVCIIDLTRDENEFLIECKLVGVETGLAVSKSVVVSGIGNAELKKGSETAVKKLMAMNDAAPGIAMHPPTAKPTGTAPSTGNKPAASGGAATKTAPPAHTPETPSARPTGTAPSTASKPAASGGAATKTAPPAHTPETPAARPTGTAPSTASKAAASGGAATKTAPPAHTPETPAARPTGTAPSTASKAAASGGAATKTAPPAHTPAAQPPPTGKWSFGVYGCAPDLGAYLHQSGDELSEGDNFDIKKDLNLKSSKMALGLRLDYLGRRCGFSLDVGSMTFAGQNRIIRNIDIDGNKFDEGVDLTSSLKNTTIDLTGTVKIFRLDHFWLGIDYGIQAWLLDVSAHGKSLSTGEIESAKFSQPVPIPQFGLSFGAKGLKDMLELRGKVHILAYSGAKYTLFAADARYYPLPWVGVRAFVENQVFDVPYGSIDDETEARLNNSRLGFGAVFRF